MHQIGLSLSTKPLQFPHELMQKVTEVYLAGFQVMQTEVLSAFHWHIDVLLMLGFSSIITG